jgi:formylglycine-generating enzyme required for sulfatase activity
LKYVARRLSQETPDDLWQSDLENFYRQESADFQKGEDSERKRVAPPPVLAPYIHHSSIRRLFILHPQEMEEVNFTGLKPEELQRYFTLTRRTEIIQVKTERTPISVFQPQTVRIPAGEFLMGSTDNDSFADEAEKPQHPKELPEYFIGKYPVTNAEYL